MNRYDHAIFLLADGDVLRALLKAVKKEPLRPRGGRGFVGVGDVPTPVPRGMTEHRLRRSTWLSGRRGQITVAGQRRTLTGFAVKRSHPGAAHLD